MTHVTIPAADTVAVAVGSVVHLPPETYTFGGFAEEYQDPPPFVGIVAVVPAALEIAVAVVPMKLIVTETTFFVAGSIFAVAVGRRVQLPPDTATAGLEVYPDPPFVTVAVVPVASDVAVAVVPLTVQVGAETVNVVVAGHVTVTSAGGGVIVRVMALAVAGKVQPLGTTKSLIVVTSQRALIFAVAVRVPHEAPENHPIVTVGAVVYHAPPEVTAKNSVFSMAVVDHRDT